MAKNLEPIKNYNDVVIGEHWAIIIGISEYRDAKLNLQFAHRDAEDLYNLLIESNGGPFKEDHITKLINEDATQSKIIKALRHFLKKPDKNDLVLIYFSCHGAYDPERPKNSYILPYDTDRDDIASTAVPMREIESSIYDNLLSEKIVIIADACHSAAIGGDRGIRNITSTAIINKYFEELAKSQEGTALITSAEANEVAFEDIRWGDGHGVFTHYLLEGIRGKADGYGRGEKDGIISIGELFEYVRDNVKEDTENKQHPLIGPSRFDRNLPLYYQLDLNEVSKAQPNIKNIKDMLEEANALFENKEWYEARDKYFEIIRTPNFLNTLCSAGRCFANIGRSHKEERQIALIFFELTLMIDPNNIFALNGKGFALNGIKKYRQAIKWFEKALEIDPNYVTAWFNKGFAHHKLYEEKGVDKEKTKAIESYKKVLELDPEHKFANLFKNQLEK